MISDLLNFGKFRKFFQISVGKIVTNTIGIIRRRKYFPVDKIDEEKDIEVTEIAMMEARGTIPLNLEEYEEKMIMIAADVTEKTNLQSKSY
jgi:hypothetical protein